MLLPSLRRTLRLSRRAGESSSLHAGPALQRNCVGASGTTSERFAPPEYPWVDPRYGVVQSSIVPCHANLLQALSGEGPAETTAADNLRTMRLTFAAYESSRTRQTVRLSSS